MFILCIYLLKLYENQLLYCWQIIELKFEAKQVKFD